MKSSPLYAFFLSLCFSLPSLALAGEIQTRTEVLSSQLVRGSADSCTFKTDFGPDLPSTDALIKLGYVPSVYAQLPVPMGYAHGAFKVKRRTYKVEVTRSADGEILREEEIPGTSVTKTVTETADFAISKGDTPIQALENCCELLKAALVEAGGNWTIRGYCAEFLSHR